MGKAIELLSPAEQAKKQLRPADHDGHHLPLRHRNIHIRDKTKPGAITDIDDFFTLQPSNPALHGAHLPLQAYAENGLSHHIPSFDKAPGLPSMKRQNLPV